jgi:hypothetical protein
MIRPPPPTTNKEKEGTMSNKQSSTDVEAITSVPVAELKRALTDPSYRLEIVEEDADEVGRRMIARTLDAQSLDEIWDTGAKKTEDIAGRPFVLQSVGWQNSEHADEPGGLPIFAVLHVGFLDTGETGVISCGAAGVVTRVIKLLEFDALPIEVVITAKKSKKRNRPIFDLEPYSGF